MLLCISYVIFINKMVISLKYEFLRRQRLLTTFIAKLVIMYKDKGAEAP